MSDNNSNNDPANGTDICTHCCKSVVVYGIS